MRTTPIQPKTTKNLEHQPKVILTHILKYNTSCPYNYKGRTNMTDTRSSLYIDCITSLSKSSSFPRCAEPYVRWSDNDFLQRGGRGSHSCLGRTTWEELPLLHRIFTGNHSISSNSIDNDQYLEKWKLSDDVFGNCDPSAGNLSPVHHWPGQVRKEEKNIHFVC